MARRRTAAKQPSHKIIPPSLASTLSELLPVRAVTRRATSLPTGFPPIQKYIFRRKSLVERTRNCGYLNVGAQKPGIRRQPPADRPVRSRRCGEPPAGQNGTRTAPAELAKRQGALPLDSRPFYDLGFGPLRSPAERVTPIPAGGPSNHWPAAGPLTAAIGGRLCLHLGNGVLSLHFADRGILTRLQTGSAFRGTGRKRRNTREISF